MSVQDLATRIIWRGAAIIITVGAIAALRYHADVVSGARVAALIGLVLLAVRVTWSVTRFCRAPRAAKRNYLRMLLAAARWRWMTRNLGLAYPDPHAKVIHRAAIGPTIGRNVRVEQPKAKIQYPRARFRADEYGIIARVRTTPRVGRGEFEKHSVHIADSWGCYRVQVAQLKPGRLVLRGIRVDPLAEPFGVEAAPTGSYCRTEWSAFAYLGRDEWADHRHANLAGVTGMTFGGLPDYGKTSLTRSLMCQDYTTPAVQFVVIDGKGGGDYLGQEERFWLPIVGHDLEAAANTLARCEALMNRRLAAAGRVPGPVNRWSVGPTEWYPLIDITVDECHFAFDLEAVKGDKKAEALVRQCRSSVANMIRMGRSVLFRVRLITQKQTGDAIPTAIRDICQLAGSFAAKTPSAAEAVLGEQIKDYPSYSPVQLQEKPTYVGVATMTLRTGSDPFVRLRVPHVTEDEANWSASFNACHVRDPEQLLDLLLLDELEQDMDAPDPTGIPA